MTFQQNGAGLYVPHALQEVFKNNDAEVTDLRERLAALEAALDDWRLITAQSMGEFSRDALRDITEMARLMFLKNPLIQRGVNVHKLYVWGQDWTVKAANEDIQAAIDAYLHEERNKQVLGAHHARQQLEVDLKLDANLFFCHFVNTITGRVRTRLIDFAEISEIICNPDDGAEPWYYKRVWTASRFDPAVGKEQSEQRTAYYPDVHYKPLDRPDTIAGHPVYWDNPVMHIHVNKFSNWRFGVSEIYAAIDWATAYKNFLEDWASIVRAYRRFAFQLSGVGSNKAVSAARARLNTTIGQTSSERNPPPVTGSTFISGGEQKLEPVRTSGATVSAEDGRYLRLMVAAAFGLPDTFFGDADVGTLATARSLDRPTELMMENRQFLWGDVFSEIFDFVMLWAVKAPQGRLRHLGRVERTIDEDDGQLGEVIVWRENIEGDVNISFPPLLQHDVAAMIDSAVKAATLGAAGQLAGTIDIITLSRTLLTFLGVEDVEEVLERLFPGGEIPEDDEPGVAPEGEERPAAEALMVSAVRELRAELKRLQEVSV